jgi:hypothetical protein
LHVKKSQVTDIIIGVLGILLIVASGVLFVRRTTPAVEGAGFPSKACGGTREAGRRPTRCKHALG